MSNEIVNDARYEIEVKLCKEKGDNGLFPKFYNNVFLFIGLTTLETFTELLFIKLSVQTFQPFILIYRRGNFVCLH